jgi:hypothetical protein
LGRSKLINLNNNKNMSNIDPELLAEQSADAEYLKELNHYVNTLSAPSAESVALYRAKLSMLEEIHTEIRNKYPDFKPEYDPSMDAALNQDLGKYQEHTYSFSTRDLNS